MKQHTYRLRVDWTGNDGDGTRSYRGYRRDHVISVDGKPDLAGSSDPAFRGDPHRHNPEDLLVAAASTCHMLSYLHRCVVGGVNVVAYTDAVCGTMEERPDGSGAITRVELRPTVRIASGGDVAKARALHAEAHHLCFIANSVNFPIEITPTIEVVDGPRAAPSPPA
jgi:organic hydroperoxide reductase OsmC/OhrA